MRIDRIELHVLSIPLVSPFETSFGVENREIHIIVKIFSEGLIGYGESPVMENPGYSYETVDTALSIQKKFIAPALIGIDINSIDDFYQTVKKIRGHNFAIYGFESALWHLMSLQEGKPLYQLLGGTNKTIQSGVSVGIKPSIEELLDQIDEYLSDGYKRIKIKIKPGWEIEPIKAIRKRFGDILLMADANSAFSLNDIELFKEIDQYSLTMIEQPLHYEDLVDHAVLQREIYTPVCLDESIKGMHTMKAAIELESCKVVNIKPARVGGLAVAKEIHDLCKENSIPVWCGGMLEMGIGRAANIALATLDNFIFPGDVSSSTRYFDKDIVDPVILFKNGELTVSEEAGTGFNANEETMEKFKLESWTLKK